MIASVEVATGRRWWARPLTVRELADLQSFPRDFTFCGPVSSGKTGTGQKERIGNAIPVKAARACAREDRLALETSRDGGFRLIGGPIWVEPELEPAAA